MLWIRGQWLLQFAHHTVHSPHTTHGAHPYIIATHQPLVGPEAKMVSGLRTSSAKGEDNVEKQYEKNGINLRNPNEHERESEKKRTNLVVQKKITGDKLGCGVSVCSCSFLGWR